MKNRVVYICKNFLPEYRLVLAQENLTSISTKAYPCFCEHRIDPEKTSWIFNNAVEGDVVVASHFCEVLKALPPEKNLETIIGSYCFSHLTCQEFLDFLTTEGSYLVSSEWLKNWEQRIRIMGFDRDTAGAFFRESVKKIVFLDAFDDPEQQSDLSSFADYLGLPYQRVNVALEGLRSMLKNYNDQWLQKQLEAEHRLALNEMRVQCAEYSAVFDLIGKISSYTTERDVIDQIRDLFVMLSGAQNFKFFGNRCENLPEVIENLKNDPASDYRLLGDQGRFLIKIQWQGIFYGIFDVGELLFPQYIEKYLNLAIEVSKFCGLVIHNNKQYEKILESEQHLKYLSFHDGLTGLYNRTFINKILSDRPENPNIIVFMFDIDRLKYVNDNFGHEAGDQVIFNFAQILKNSFRETDIIARIGGDEFIAILQDADLAMAEAFKNRIIEQLLEHNQRLASDHLKLSFSIGYSRRRNATDTIESAMKRADERMYEDKMSRRSPSGSAANERSSDQYNDRPL